MMSRFRIVKRGDPETVVGEGMRFSSGMLAVSVFNDARAVGVHDDIVPLRSNLRAVGYDIDWLDIPDDDFAEPATPV